MRLHAVARTSDTPSNIGAAIVCAVGITALIGWVVDSDGLKAIYSGGIVIKTNTAIALFAAGLSLLLLRPDTRSRSRTTAGRLLAWLVVGLGAATLSEHIVGWDLGIDNLVFREGPGAVATMSPNRMGPPASLCLPLLGLALLGLDRPSTRSVARFQVLALCAIVIALLPVLGYVFGVSQLYGVARYTGIALHTALSFLVIAFSILLARPEVGLMRRVLGDDGGGVLLRRLLPAAVLLPILLGGLRVLGQTAGLYDTEFGRAVLILSFIIVFSLVVWSTSGAVQRAAFAREQAEAVTREMHDQLLRTLQSERAARAMAERSNRMKDEFLATVSHELRTPLNAIVGWVQLLARKNLDSKDGRRGLEAIDRNSRLQVRLIEDLLDMSRIESGKLRLEPREVDLGLVIEAALLAVGATARDKGVALERDGPVDVCLVHGDPARLQQILWNLLSNAIKFTPAGGRVSVRVTRVDARVEVQVRDTGAGIAPEFIDQVFDRFRQADSSTTRRYGGLGLGLSIARQLAELHGGTLQAESAGEGRGATFSLALPLASVSRAGAPVVTAAARIRGDDRMGAESVRGLRVLVVDDQPDACELVERVLSEQEAEIRCANSVDEAIDWLARESFDVLVSDIGMPVRDGFDLIRHVRRTDSGLRAIALTAFARAEDKQAVLAAGFDDYLAKPVVPHELVMRVATLARRASRPVP